MTQSLKLVDGINIYKGDDYKFKLVDEKYHRYAWLIVKEEHNNAKARLRRIK